MNKGKQDAIANSPDLDSEDEAVCVAAIMDPEDPTTGAVKTPDGGRIVVHGTWTDDNIKPHEPSKPKPSSISVTFTGAQESAIREFHEILGVGSLRQFVIHLVDLGMNVHVLTSKGPLTGRKFAGAMWRVGQANLMGEMRTDQRAITETLEAYESWRQKQLLAPHPRSKSPTRLIKKNSGRGG